MSIKISAYRRNNGDGFLVEINVLLPNGVPHRERKKLTLSKSDCDRWARKREANLMLNGLRASENRKEVATKKFGEFANQYLAEKEADGAEVKPSYMQFMRYAVDGHLRRAFGDVPLTEVTEPLIDDFRRALKAPRKSGRVTGDKGVNNVLALLAKILRRAEALKLIDEAPEVVMLKRDKKAKRGQTKIKADGKHCYNEEQFTTNIEAAREVSPVAYLVYLLGGDHGLRRGEMMSLKWTDVDVGGGTLTVNTSVWIHRGERHEGLPKGGSIRELDMTPPLIAALKKTKRHGVYVLPELTTYDKFRKVIEEVQARAGFPVTGKAHVLRHTFCSRLALKGVAVKVIQTLAGHANIETTERYLHSDREQERAAMATLHREPETPDSNGTIAAPDFSPPLTH